MQICMCPNHSKMHVYCRAAWQFATHVLPSRSPKMTTSKHGTLHETAAIGRAPLQPVRTDAINHDRGHPKAALRSR